MVKSQNQRAVPLLQTKRDAVKNYPKQSYIIRVIRTAPQKSRPTKTKASVITGIMQHRIDSKSIDKRIIKPRSLTVVLAMEQLSRVILIVTNFTCQTRETCITPEQA
jgi:hypothetical protein